jgi:hypothetical protein
VKETDLYIPVKELLTELGYDIRSEVRDVDIAAIKGDELIIIELKTSYNLKLIIQAAKRQRLTDQVYIAIPRPVYKKRFARDFKDREFLLRRLGLGLIFVAMDAEQPYAKIVFEPTVFDMNRSQINSRKRKNKLLKEFEGRSTNYNTGGSVKQKLVTAYRERSLKIACIMADYDIVSTKKVKEEGGPAETTKILYDNYYGWFEKVGRGKYRISDSGARALTEYAGILKNIKEVEHE